MSKVQEIEAAVRRLSRDELATFRDWFSEFDAAEWDAQIGTDAKAGLLDDLADETIRDAREGRVKRLRILL